MLDFNHRPKISEKINLLIDKALTTEHSKQTSRDYLGASRLGASCSRALQFEYTDTPKDEDQNFTGRILKIFQAGHVFEDLIIGWLKNAGFNLVTRKQNGDQFGFFAAKGKLKGHIDGVIIDAPEDLGFAFPMLFECKSLNNKSWKEVEKKGLAVAKPIYAAQVAIYQAYMESQIEGICKNPALFTAINKDTAEIYFELIEFDKTLAQKTSDKAVMILRATEAHELLPRIATDSTHFECKFCPWQQRCWRL
ncbi:MAG: hypothetical protein EBS06_08240 [Proteobacteria bacterium]|nr:hypothetical protein [Pseudomonadota bacterium]